MRDPLALLVAPQNQYGVVLITGGFMRLFLGFLLAVSAWVSPALLETGGAPAFSAATRLAPHAAEHPLVHEAKIVCGDFGQGFTCRREDGAIRRGKQQKIPGSSDSSGSSGSSGGGWFGGGSEDPDALPPPGSASAPSAAPTSCPANTELLGGHCIPFTQTCQAGLAAATPPQACRQAEEKLVCNFRADGLKDCCCRTYSKF